MAHNPPRNRPQGLPKKWSLSVGTPVAVARMLNESHTEVASARRDLLVNASRQSVASGPFEETQPHTSGQERPVSRCKRRRGLESRWSGPVRGATLRAQVGSLGSRERTVSSPSVWRAAGRRPNRLAGAHQAAAGSHVRRGSPPSCFRFVLCLVSAKGASRNSRPKERGLGSFSGLGVQNARAVAEVR